MLRAKEEKKIERLEKKKERDEIAKRKAEERSKKAERRSRKAAEKSKKVVRPERQSKRSTRESTSSYLRVLEDTVPTTSAVGTSLASVESSRETHSDSLTDTVVAATGAGESDNVF